MTKIIQTYIRRGRELSIATRAEGEVAESLPVGTYRLCFDPMRGWWLTEVHSFKVPEKLYGNVIPRSKRILDTYNSRRENGDATGVLLSGTKGSGKTLLAKKVSADSNLPVIIINDPYTSDDFKEIVANIGPCVLIFDEFEKVYHRHEDQNSVLTLLDGVFSNEVLSFVIVNDSWKLVGPLRNRPGRLYYALEYGSLNEEFIIEYARDRLNPVMRNIAFGHEQEVDVEATDKMIKGIISVASMLKEFTFDHLQAMVEEMNRYGESALEVIDYLNVKLPKPGYLESYKITIFYNGQDISHLQNPSYLKSTYTPIERQVHIYYRIDKDEDEDAYVARLNSDKLVKVDVENNKLIFIDEDVKICYERVDRLGEYDYGYGPRDRRYID